MRQPDYYSTIVFVCQEVFEKFLKFFQSFFQTARVAFLIGLSPFGDSFDSIAHLISFVKRFLKVFSTFSQNHLVSMICALLRGASLKACIVYHTLFHLSTPFCDFFAFFRAL